MISCNKNAVLRFRKLHAKRDSHKRQYFGSDSSWVMNMATNFNLRTNVRDMRRRRGLQYENNIFLPFNEIYDTKCYSKRVGNA